MSWMQPHLGRQPIARWYFPPEVDYRLNLLPPEAKGLVVWIIEAKVTPPRSFSMVRVNLRAPCFTWESVHCTIYIFCARYQHHCSGMYLVLNQEYNAWMNKHLLLFFPHADLWFILIFFFFATFLLVYVWKVLSKAELQFLALLPSLRPKVRVIAECGNW